MGLTRIRAEQISDIDYKQAVRVISLADVTLSGGAPSSVDGVNLVIDDRILVAGQNTGSQNGLYYVQTVGSGSNGTWVRSTDGNETGELQAGMIIMVTEGDAYKDTQWKLTTNNPIIIGTTALVFEQNSAYAFGNIYANGTAVLATTVGDSVTLTAGDNIAITGNNTSKTVTIGVTGISLNSISNGTSNVTVVSSGGNVTVGVAGSEVAEFSTVGVDITGNITGSNLNTAGQVVATGNVTGGNIVTSGIISATGNITGGNLVTAGLVSATGNITGGNILGNGAGLSGINSFGVIGNGTSNISAASIGDTLTITAETGIDYGFQTDVANNTITLVWLQVTSIFETGGDMGTVTEAVTSQEDLGLVTETPAATEIDMGTIVTAGVIYPDQLVLPSYTVGTLPSASPAAQMVFVTNETGGAVPAFSDGTNWRRVTDRQIVS